MVNPVSFVLILGEREVPIVDQYTYFMVETLKDCRWYVQFEKEIGNGKSLVDMKDAIPTDPHLDTRIEICITMNMMVPMLE